MKNRYKIAYGLWDSIKHYVFGCCCRSPAELRKKHLFREAMIKIDEELDIRHINNQLRTLKFITNILLPKF